MLFCAVEAMAESTIGRGPVTIDEIQEIARSVVEPPVGSFRTGHGGDPVRRVTEYAARVL